jgi:hypothetical protein
MASEIDTARSLPTSLVDVFAFPTGVVRSSTPAGLGVLPEPRKSPPAGALF